jgi:hypothetical protein
LSLDIPKGAATVSANGSRDNIIARKNHDPEDFIISPSTLLDFNCSRDFIKSYSSEGVRRATEIEKKDAHFQY